MTGAFDDQFAGQADYRPEGTPDPRRVAACADAPAEAALIGALLASDTLINDVADKIGEGDFADPLFAAVFDAVLMMSNSNEVATPITVARRLAFNDELAQRGGARYLADLTLADAVARGPGYAAHLVDLSRRRRLQVDLARARTSTADTAKPLTDIVHEMDVAASVAIDGLSASPPPIGIGAAWDATMASVSAIAAGTAPRGVQIFGLPEWNEITGGMHPGQFVILGGRPGMGKTAVALAVARRAAQSGHGVLFISLEMPVEQLMLRLIADILHEKGSRVTFDDVQRGRLADYDRRLAQEARAEIDAWPMIFEEPPGLNAARIAPMIRRTQRSMAARNIELGLVVLDYLGLLSPPEKRDGRTAEMSDISWAVKVAARGCRVPILGLAQLNRAVETREDKRPVLPDLRDSGSLEQDADTVVFVYRAEYYLRKSEPDRSNTKWEAWNMEFQAERDRVEVYSDKVRQGSPTKRRLYFYGRHQAVRSAVDHSFDGGWGQP